MLFIYCCLLIKQGVALTGRNTTGPPSRAAPGELRCICAAVECYRRRQTPESKTILPPTLCVGGPVINKCHIKVRTRTLKPATDKPGCPAGLPGRSARPGNPVVIGDARAARPSSTARLSRDTYGTRTAQNFRENPL